LLLLELLPFQLLLLVVVQIDVLLQLVAIEVVVEVV
jgi:hypothetical protein